MPAPGRLFPLRGFSLLSLLAILFVGCAESDKPVAKSNSEPSASAPAGTKRLIFLTNGEDPFWDTCNAGFQEAAKTLGLQDAKLTVDFHKNSGGEVGQINRLKQYGTESDIAGIAISVVNADNVGIAKEMKSLMDAGVKVITVDGDLNMETYPGHRSYYIGTDNLVAGRVLGTAAKQVLASRKKESGAYVQFAGFRDNDNARKRMNGFQETIGESYKELDRMPDQMARDKARDNVRAAIDNFEKDGLVALVGIWAYNAPAIAGVVKERKARDKFAVCTFDADQQAIVDMGEGNIDVMVVQNPFDMGFQAVRMMKAMLANDEATIKEMFPKPAGEPGADVYTTGLRVVVPGPESPLKPEMFDSKTVEFMELPAFKSWLDKYKLISS
ncbi:substrate-binding domain-containing protein [Planctomyces sp. SH-PL14]|uniref:substrate-binding domain-containing protein n=1 Tax=Planctomyces sp. SH-PL14 TaxID=1632864 RepID=UPI00078B7574|nr:substrate-binding domain-containing protein [Planctomyces sp. SH-PL14]AMV17564.1 D-allose transporter subunit [Planctomyces sp. SH-PL14]